ncbi:glycosyl hydrolase [Microlunatus ginsengisoli]|uniref:glucan endo-1,3-beta-D-glucosidase n=1 Tax=Microlunatus ginsengisoli TaxID=363863 RepID=A0ABP6ZGU1_9ACTN
MPSPQIGLPGNRPSASCPTRTTRLRRAPVAVLSAIALVLASLIAVGSQQAASAATVGAGSYTTTLPAGQSLPTGCGDISTNPRQWVTSNAPSGAVPTNDWWSSILFKKTDCAFGEPMFAHPAAYDSYPGGIGISYTTTPVITGTSNGVGEYKFPYTRDVLVGVAGLNAPNVKVDGWSDWTVSPIWSDGARTLRATIGHGLPMSYYTVSGGNAQLSVDGTPRVWLNSGTKIGFSIRDHDYVAYAPAGSSWNVSGTVITSSLNGKNYFTVAVLPTTASSTDSQRTDLAGTYGTYAYAHVTGTKISYNYDQATGTVTSTYGFTTTPKEGSQTKTVVSLYPHQWKALSGATPISQTYASPRGTMKTLVGVPSFTTKMKFHGILPELPAVADGAGADKSTLVNYLNQVANDPAGEQKPDTYWAGKGLGRSARIAEIADLVGETGTRDKALAAMKSTLTNWLTASSGETDHLFYYDKNWGTLIGYDASYGSDQELNDHHFHYGYFIAAAATLAKFDPNWAKSTQYGGMIDLLIRDANNYDRSDTRFPYLRDFDIYAGHDWASGHGSFASGNNQESSSEGMNFAGALIQWGQATGNTAVRDAGIYIYTTQAAAIDDYWFDVDNTTFPKNFGHSAVGMVWGDGGAYATWFSADPEKIQGINQLPITGSHLYLGWNPSYNKINYDEIVRNRGGEPTAWQDILWEFLALGDGDLALSKFKANPNFVSEEGETKAHTYHWIDNLAKLGNVDASLTANYPLAAAFTKSGKKTYVVSNIATSALTVTFSDGTKVTAPAGKTVAAGAQSWSGGNAGANPTSPPPTSTPTATPTSTPTATPTGTPTGTPTSTPTGTPTSTPTGSPTSPPVPGKLYLRSDGSAGGSQSAAAVTLPAANCQCDGTPTNAKTFTASGVSATLTGAPTFDLFVDAGTGVGSATQVRISYDLTGNGSWDRVETYRYFPTDPIPGYEHYTQNQQLLSSTGTLGNLSGGKIKIEVWSAIGNQPTTLGVGNQSVVTLAAG